MRSVALCLLLCCAQGDSTAANESLLTIDESSSTEWLTNFIPISTISLAILGLVFLIGIFFSRFFDKCHSQLAINDDDSDMSENTRYILKLQMKTSFAGKVKKTMATKKAVEKWRKDNTTSVTMEDETDGQTPSTSSSTGTEDQETPVRRVSIIASCDSTSTDSLPGQSTARSNSKSAVRCMKSSTPRAVSSRSRVKSVMSAKVRRPLTSLSRANSERLRTGIRVTSGKTTASSSLRKQRPRTAVVPSPLPNRPPMRLLVRPDASLVGSPYSVCQVPKNMRRQRPVTAVSLIRTADLKPNEW